jgi:phosphoglycerol transferase
MLGSDANFGGRRNFYTRHGNYKIFDVQTAINEEKMSESDIVWWDLMILTYMNGQRKK